MSTHSKFTQKLQLKWVTWARLQMLITFRMFCVSGMTWKCLWYISEVSRKCFGSVWWCLGAVFEVSLGLSQACLLALQVNLNFFHLKTKLIFLNVIMLYLFINLGEGTQKRTQYTLKATHYTLITTHYTRWYATQTSNNILHTEYYTVHYTLQTTLHYTTLIKKYTRCSHGFSKTTFVTD